MNLFRSRLRVMSVGGRNWAIVDGKQWERATQARCLRQSPKDGKVKVEARTVLRSAENSREYFWKLSYSTVTDFARFLGWSTSQPRRTAM